jgi:hypothetical protein
MKSKWRFIILTTFLNLINLAGFYVSLFLIKTYFFMTDCTLSPSAR